MSFSNSLSPEDNFSPEDIHLPLKIEEKWQEKWKNAGKFALKKFAKFSDDINLIIFYSL